MQPLEPTSASVSCHTRHNPH